MLWQLPSRSQRNHQEITLCQILELIRISLMLKHILLSKKLNMALGPQLKMQTVHGTSHKLMPNSCKFKMTQSAIPLVAPNTSTNTKSLTTMSITLFQAMDLIKILRLPRRILLIWRSNSHLSLKLMPKLKENHSRPGPQLTINLETHKTISSQTLVQKMLIFQLLMETSILPRKT